MLAISNEQNNITISFSANELPAQDIEEIIEFFKREFLARQSRLSDETAMGIAEEMKTEWWKKHQTRILSKAGA